MTASEAILFLSSRGLARLGIFGVVRRFCDGYFHALHVRCVVWSEPCCDFYSPTAGDGAQLVLGPQKPLCCV